MVDFQKKKIKLVDFGSSKNMFRRKCKVDMWSLAGTPLYRAPEMFGGCGYNERVDIWAVGATLYQMVVGKTPF
jgi:serine/threonine protein kinase